MEVKGLKKNTGKIKVMFSCCLAAAQQTVDEQGKWLYGVCKKGVGNNSILWKCCQKWMNKRCSGGEGKFVYG